jgi:hypothetical protein
MLEGWAGLQYRLVYKQSSQLMEWITIQRKTWMLKTKRVTRYRLPDLIAGPSREIAFRGIT